MSSAVWGSRARVVRSGDGRWWPSGDGGVARRIDAGHGEFALQTPGQQRVRGGRGGPGEVAGAEEPEGVEGGAGGFERAHDLDGRVAGFGGEEGLGGDAFERGEGGGEGDAGAVEVECG